MKLDRFTQLVLVGLASTWSVNAFADAPGLLPVQGYVTDMNGVPLRGPVNMTFSVYTTETGGTARHTEVADAVVTDGSFTVLLGTNTAFDLGLIRDSTDLWLGLSIAGAAELTPRIRLATAPYAAFSAYAGDANLFQGRPASDFADAVHSHSWGDLSGIPADLADGDQGANYSAGTGIVLTGTTFSVDQATIDQFARAACFDTEAEISVLLDDNYAALNHAHAWTTITGIPADILDGDQGGNYTAGAGLQLTGTAFSIANDGVTAAHIATNAVGTAEVAADSLTAADLAADSVTAAEIAADAVTAAEIATDAVTAAEIAADAVTAAEIATDAVGATEIATDAVGTAEIATNAVGAAEIATDAVGSAEIATDAVTAAEISADAVGSAEIAADAVGAAEIAADAVTAAEIATNAVGTDEIASAAVGGDELQSVLIIGDTVAPGGLAAVNNLNNQCATIAADAATGVGYVNLTDPAGNAGAFVVADTADGHGVTALFARDTTTNTDDVIVLASTVTGAPLQGAVGVFNNGTLAAGIFGDGTVFGTTKNFVTAHPTQPEKVIVYAAVEGPEAAMYARGTARLSNGRVEISLPEHFQALASASGMTVTLTPRSSRSLGLAAVSVEPNRLVVEELHSGSGSYDFDYQVVAVRKGFENYRAVRDASELSMSAPPARQPL